MSRRFILTATLLGMIGWAVVALIAGSLNSAFSQTYLTATLASYHFDRDKPYRESNPGLGIEQKLNSEWSISAGFFRNSFNRHTNYVFAGYAPLQFESWRVGAVMGAVTGYENGVSPWFTGIATRDYGRIGLNVVFSAAGIALQVKYQLSR